MKKGNTLVESIISLSIILIALTLSIQIIAITSKSINLRRNKEKANRVAYAIENEIKYNISFTNLKDVFNKGNLFLKYNDDILESLLTTPLTDLESGNNIIIEKVMDNSIEEDYKISTFKIKIFDLKGGILAEREFIKSYWMDI
ncbi:type II secretion system protein [Clostridium nigeriense]|uniref:type II secretion system protein n=1 Tax=Clostridium nigeriense TaxID=1805470 RepID=UPI003D354F46